MENLPAGLYSVFATSERLTSTVSNGSSWLMVGVNDNVPGSGHSGGITIPSNVPYATVNYSRYFNVPEDGGSINAYIKAADISANFNVILQAVRIA